MELKLNVGFLEGLGVGTFLAWFLGKFLPVLYKDWSSKKSERTKAAIQRCDAVSDACHKILKKSVLVYCSEYDRAESLQLRTDFNDLSILIKELNSDLIFIKKSDLIVGDDLIISFRQKVTNKIFEIRSDNFLVTDPLIVEIDDAGQRVIEKFRQISRELR